MKNDIWFFKFIESVRWGIAGIAFAAAILEFIDLFVDITSQYLRQFFSDLSEPLYMVVR